MKKILLMSTVMLIGLTTVHGQNTRRQNAVKTVHYRFAEPITFVERGVEFLIFPDGSFDFNTDLAYTYYDANMSRRTGTRLNSFDVSLQTRNISGRVQYSTPYSRSIYIAHDWEGKITRIGNVVINYDREGRIARAGSVIMKYQRGNGNLRQVGGLKVNYNHWGEIVQIYGVVNAYNANIHYVVGNNLREDHIYNDFDHHDDGDFYYYRKGNEIKKQKKSKRTLS